jgi:REP element-mobilizing transposase RayT
MANSYVNLVYHMIFSTKERRPLIKEPFSERLCDYLGGAIRGEGGQPIKIGGAEDHMHALAHLRQDRSLSDVLRRIKSNSTGWVHDHFPELRAFSWQEGYAAFTVSQSNVEAVRAYIARQAEHHKRRSFQEELAELFERHGIKPDVRFWTR